MLTLVVRHQQLQCYYNINQDVIGKDCECGPSDTVSTDVLSGLGLETSLASEPYRYAQVIILFTVFFTLVALFCRTKWVIYDGIEYRKPCMLIVAVDDDDPMLGRLEESFVVSSEIYFKVSMQTIVHYSVHFHAYVVTSHSPKEYKLVKINDLFSPFPRTVSTLTSSGQYAVVLKHGLCTL